MNRSKIVAGVGTVILAAVGAFTSAKAFAPNDYWYIDQNTQQCVTTRVDFDCTLTGTPDCVGEAGTPSEEQQLFITDSCTRPLHRL